MEWYKSLNINMRIQAKDCFKMICGYDFSEMGLILSFKERIEVMHEKLKLEGFEV